jgi:hypothetical protein
MNDNGVVSGYSIDGLGHTYAVTWSPPYTTAHKLPVIGAAQSVGGKDYSQDSAGNEALGINNAGETVGFSTIGGPVPDTQSFATSRAWRPGISPLFRPVAWTPSGAPAKLPVGYAQGFAWAVNDAGVIVGDSDIDANGDVHPVSWTAGGAYHDMAAGLDVGFGNAYGERGSWAAGGVVLGSGTSRAFVWTGSGVLQTLEPPASFTDSWSLDANQKLHQVGGAVGSASASPAAVWQCPAGLSTGG